MRAVAHNPAFAKKVGVPQSVGKDYAEADKGRKFGSGGSTMKESKAMMKKEVSFMKKKGAPKSMIKHEESEHESVGMKRKVKMARGGGIESRGKTKGTMIKMARGGGIEVRGKTKGKMVKMNYGGMC